MGTRETDIQTLRTLRSARMKPASIAATMGRSLAWVERESAALDAAIVGGGGVKSSPNIPSAGDVAIAVVAAAVQLDVIPTAVFGPGRLHVKARLLAGAGLVAAGRADPASARRVCGLERPTALAPTYLATARVTPQMVAAVVLALGGEVPPPPPPAVKEALTAGTPAPSPEPTAPRPAPPSPVARQAQAPECVVRLEPRRSSVRRAHTGRSAAVTRLRPVTPKIRRFAEWFADARWPLEEVAELFDVDVEDLADAIERAA